MVLRSDTLANWAVIVMCLMVTTVAAVRFMEKPSATRAASANLFKAGERVESFKDVNFASSDLTLLVVVRKDCRFCAESLPFYQRLAQEVVSRSARLIAVSVDPVDLGRKYLSDAGVSVADVIPMPADAAPRITGTPTMLAVDQNGQVVATWVGRLSSKQEDEVLILLRSRAKRV